MNIRTLLVEADPSVRCLIEGVLCRRGHAVVCASNGETAWAACEQHRFPLVLLDWQLPEWGGPLLCRRIREVPDGEDCVVLVMTTESHPDELDRIFEAGASGYIRKPFGLRRLDARLAFAERQVARTVERAHAEQERTRQLQEAAALEARTELERFMSEVDSIISHEFRTPLASLVGFSELLLTRQVSEANQREWLGILHDDAVRLSGLIDSILDAARLRQGNVKLDLRPLDVKAVVEAALLNIAVPSNAHQILRRFHEPLPTVLADAEKVSQILGNLISNAVKYSPGGGAIMVGAESTGDVVHLSVQDQGLGLSPGEIDGLFQRFHRVNDVRRNIRGLGLGLFVAKQLVQLHGGRIWAESPGPGLGSTFHVELPLAPSGGSIA